MKFLTLTTFLSIFGLAAQAESFRLISIKSEAEPSKVAYLGVNTDSKNKITEVFMRTTKARFLITLLPV
jgi:hypothetical protein